MSSGKNEFRFRDMLGVGFVEQSERRVAGWLGRDAAKHWFHGRVLSAKLHNKEGEQVKLRARVRTGAFRLGAEDAAGHPTDAQALCYSSESLADDRAKRNVSLVKKWITASLISNRNRSTFKNAFKTRNKNDSQSHKHNCLQHPDPFNTPT